MNEPVPIPLPVELLTLKNDLGEMQFNKLASKSRTILEKHLKIELPKDEVGKRIIETLTPYVLDPGSIYPLEELSDEILPTKYVNDEKLTYQNNKLAPQEVLSTIAGSMMIDNGKEVWWVDGKNMYSANEVSEKSNLVGDRMLRRIAELFFSKIEGIELTRYQGDGFLISRDKNAGNLEEEILNIKKQISTDSELRNKLSAFFRIDGNMLLDIGDFNLKKETPSLIVERDQKNSQEELEIRVNKLLEYHPEFKTLTEDFKTMSLEDRSKVMEILEKSVFDHVIQPVAEKLSEKNFMILAYRDVHDMTEHFAGQEIDMLKIDIASMLKKINDAPGLGTDIGDEYLKVLFTKVVDSIKKDNPNLKEIGVLRRWGDFFIPMEKEQAKLIKEKLEKMFNDECWYLTIDGDKKNPSVNFIREDDKKEHKSILSVMPIIGIQTNINLELTKNKDGEVNFDAIKNNDKKVNIVMNGLDEEVRRSRPKKTKERLKDPRWTQIDWNHLAETMINPLDLKRGRPRLLNIYGATREELTELISLYNGTLEINPYGGILESKDYDGRLWMEYRELINKILNRVED